MKISTRIRYGLRAVINIAEGNLNENRLVRIKEIALDQNISVQYLEQILFKLKKKDIIKGKRGPNGGYKITKAPEDITALELYEILDEEVKVVDCNEEKNQRCIKNDCRTNCLWSQLDNALKEILGKTTLADLMKNKDMV
ncbi:MAG: Rrf2 family transcriptional regulator [Fusobacteriia bacterium 4572_74]|nr:MAG: Rrf2 family transcriptional regulator [Fusobacteriia bacterium 4572_74]